LLIETDSPYLAPVPYRGKKNEPRYLPAVAQAVADIKGLSLAEIASITTRNFGQLFGVLV
jgi:TatD DNase family protein